MISFSELQIRLYFIHIRPKALASNLTNSDFGCITQLFDVSLDNVA